MHEADLIAEAVLKAGVMLLKSGAEVYRVENTMDRLGKSFIQTRECMSYVTLTGAFVTLTTSRASVTRMARVEETGYNLHRINEINTLSRECLRCPMTPEDVIERLEAIEAEAPYRARVKILSAGAGAAGFGVFFGAEAAELIGIFLIGLLVAGSAQLFERFKVNTFLITLFQAAIAAEACLLYTRYTDGLSLDIMIISVLMLLVPGMTLTNGIRDMLSGNYLSGAVCLAQAMFIGAFIALGAGLALYGRI